MFFISMFRLVIVSSFPFPSVSSSTIDPNWYLMGIRSNSVSAIHFFDELSDGYGPISME